MIRLAALRFWPALPLLPRPAAAQDVLALVRADRWAEAEPPPAASSTPSPASSSPGTACRARAPPASPRSTPSWRRTRTGRARPTLARRREEALAAEPDDSTVLGFCARLTPHGAAALLRCADALRHDDQNAAALADARGRPG